MLYVICYMYGKKEVHASVVVSGSSSRALRSFRIMRTRVQWQVEYWRHGEPHWWDYPAYVNDDLELIKGGWSVGAGGSDYMEFTYQYPKKRKRLRLDVDDKGCMDSDTEDEQPRYGGTVVHTICTPKPRSSSTASPAHPQGPCAAFSLIVE